MERGEGWTKGELGDIFSVTLSTGEREITVVHVDVDVSMTEGIVTELYFENFYHDREMTKNSYHEITENIP